MNEKEYNSKIPYYCYLYIHQTQDVCWNIVYGFIDRFGSCRGCDYYIMAKRKTRFWNTHSLFDRKREYIW